MADVKWIKLCTDVFDDEKIQLIDGLPERDGILVIWFKLLCLAGKQNNGGVFMLNDKIAYTDEMLATIFRRPLSTLRLALKTFENFGMVEIVNETITIPNWNKHQSLDKLEQAKEKNRKRVAKHREKQRLIAANGVSVCQYCGGVATGFDHIIPIARGGKDIQKNKVPCCIECNRKKNDKPLVEFLNNNRDSINDEIITANKTLSKYVTLCNVTGHYIVTESNATDKEEEKEKEKELEQEAEVVKGADAPDDYDNPDNQLQDFCGGVFLTENQIADLLDKMGLEAFDFYIAKAKKYPNIKNYYKTILKWYDEDRAVKV